MPKVLNARTSPKSSPTSVYVGRPSGWGNPFIIGVHGNRDEVVELYRKLVVANPHLFPVHELRGKDLVCWCAPNACHADVLLELANPKGV